MSVIKEMIEIASNKIFAENYAKSIMRMQNLAGTAMTHICNSRL